VIQSDLWHDTILDAVGAAVQASGGVKKVGPKLWPTLDTTSAASKLRSALSPDCAQKLCPMELLMLGKLAKESGDTSVMDFLAREWGFEVKPLAPAETKKLAKRARRLALLEELKRLEEE
jgi:hypothetical protein